jgi:hypothetical protein
MVPHGGGGRHAGCKRECKRGHWQLGEGNQGAQLRVVIDKPSVACANAAGDGG